MTTKLKTSTAVLATVRDCIGASRVLTDPPILARFSVDLSGESVAKPIALLKPDNVDELCRAVAALAEDGVAMVVRGGGTTATGGALPLHGRSVVIDMTELNRIIEINEADGYVTVEAGCTWAALNAALRTKGLRTPMFGTLWGRYGTVGGSVSTNTGFFGAGLQGGPGHDVLSVDVIMPDGSLVETGSAAAEGRTPFFRHFGPDLTGLFLGDGGAFGLKARVSLRVTSAPSHEDYLSFAFERFEDVAEAHIALMRETVAAEQYSFDPHTNDDLAARGFKALEGLSFETEIADVKGGMGQKMATKSRTLIDGHRLVMRGGYSLHVVVEGTSLKDVELKAGRVRRIAMPLALKELPNTVPQTLRGKPFDTLNIAVGKTGQNRLTVHGILPASRAVEIAAITDEYFVRHRDLMKEHQITVCWTAGCIGNGFLIEPTFCWSDRISAAHERHISTAQYQAFAGTPPNPAARDAVATLRRDLAMLWGTYGAVYMDIGKFYPYASVLSSASLAFLKTMKAAMDPGNVMNPGALDLGGTKTPAKMTFNEFPQNVLTQPFKFR
jgi:D-lactate dehydrogenase (cytochrome)